MDKSKIIQHSGIITSAYDGKIQVRIRSASACSSCHAKGSCSVADVEDKIVDVFTKKQHKYKIGDQVNVVLKRSLGAKAVFYGYFLPFLIVLISLIAFVSITKNEGLAGLLALGLLIPYYLLLYYFRNRIKRVFQFSLQE